MNLSLWDNKIGDGEVARCFLRILGRRSLFFLRKHPYLNLDRSYIGNDGVMKMARALETNTTLTELKLWHNNIGDEGATRVARALETNTTLTKLNLWVNNIGAEGATRVARALETNTILKQLYLFIVL